MITVFPDPYPEELLYSFVARYQARLMTSRRAAILELFGTADVPVAFNLPSRLGTLVSNLFPGNAYSPEVLIRRHTLLPYFAPFLEGNQLISVTEAMIGEGGLAAVAKAGIAASTVKEPAALQFCPRCVDADRAQYGEAFWHRVHQLPGVRFCPHHSGTAVLNSSVSRNARTLVTLEAILANAVYAIEQTARQFRPLLEFIARESLWLLINWTPSVGLVTIHERYIAALQQRDLALPNGRVRPRELVDRIIDTFGHDLLRHWGCDFAADSKEPWLLRMVRQRKWSQHPLKHLLLLHFLGLDAETFLRPDVRRTKPKLEPWPCLNPAADHWAGSGKTKELPITARDCHAAPRKAWLQHQADNPGACRTELQQTLWSTYMFLYRHDREWLMEHQPESRRYVRTDRKTRVNWAESDKALVVQVAAAVERLKMQSDPLVRVSAAAIGRELRCLSRLRNHKKKMRNTWNEIFEVAENRTAFACRRLLYTWNSLVDTGIKPKPRKLLRQAGISTDLAKRPEIRSFIETLTLENCFFEA